MAKYSYDPIARAYLADRARLKSGKYVQKLMKLIPKGASVIDVGCGAGWPVDDLLVDAGYSVTGIDSSVAMIAEAQRRVLGANYVVRDMRELSAGEYAADAIVSFYALFHTPRAEHGRILAIWHSFLSPGGYLLATFGDREFEGEHELYGQTVWSSQWGVKKNRELVTRAGFTILSDEVDRTGGEAHQVILARA